MADEVLCPPLLNNLGEFQPSNMIFDKALAKNVKSYKNRKKLSKKPNLSKNVFFHTFF